MWTGEEPWDKTVGMFAVAPFFLAFCRRFWNQTWTWRASMLRSLASAWRAARSGKALFAYEFSSVRRCASEGAHLVRLFGDGVHMATETMMD